MSTIRISTVAVLFIGSLAAQAPITGVGNFSHIVSNMDRSIEFYRDVIGLELPGQPGAFTGNPAILNLANVPTGAQVRYTVLRVPGSAMGVEIIEYKDIDRKPIHTRTQDPGTPILQLRARDVDALAKAWKAAGGEIVSAHGGSVTLGANQAIVLRDPNGLILEILPAPQER